MGRAERVISKFARVGGLPDCLPTAIGILNLVRPFARLGLTFQIFLPDIGFLFQLIGQYQQVPVNQSIAVGWNARHPPQEFCLLAELLHTDHCVKCLLPDCSDPAWSARRR